MVLPLLVKGVEQHLIILNVNDTICLTMLGLGVGIMDKFEASEGQAYLNKVDIELT